MKIIKGLLKNFSWFDYSALLVILIVALVVFFFFYRKSEYVDIRIKVTDQNVLYAWNYPQNWYANSFKKGDVERDVLGRVITEIKNVESFNIDDLRKAVYLDLRVRATYDSRTKLYSARGKALNFGSPVRFSLSGVTFDGIVTEFPNSELQENLIIDSKKVDVLVRGIQETEKGKEFVEPEVVDSIKVGDKIVDSNSRLLAEVLEIETNLAERVTEDDRGNLLLRHDPFYKDALITLNLRAKTVNNESYVFDDFPLRLGKEVELTFSDVFVKGKIIKIYSD